MPEIIFSMHKVGLVTRNKKEILKDISLSFYLGAKIGILGLNGAGKSTLLKIIAGKITEYTGEVSFAKNLNIGYLAQEPELMLDRSVRDNVIATKNISEIFELLEQFNNISNSFATITSDDEMQSLLEQQAKLQEKIDNNNGWEIERSLDLVARSLRLPPWEQTVSELSGGEKRRVALAKLVLSKPDILLLDEPTNHLDATSVSWLEKFLAEFPGTVIAVTHDRYFLDNVAKWILELDRGRGIPFEGNYSNWLEYKDKRLASEQQQEAARKRSIKSELEWVRKSPKGRQSKNKARLQRFEELASNEYQKRLETQEIFIPPGPRLGDQVIEFSQISKSYENKSLFTNLDLSIPKGSIVGIIGPNGAGKSTMLKLITGQETPDSGNITVGESVKLSYVDQQRDHLNGKQSVWEEISGGLDHIEVGRFVMSSRSFVGRFNFKGADQQKSVGDLSGGERNRVHLAKLLKAGGNVLLLDEPTNDLDVETMRALEQALLEFPGTILIISHDRWFLDRICTHIMDFAADGGIKLYEGSYSEYETSLA